MASPKMVVADDDTVVPPEVAVLEFGWNPVTDGQGLSVLGCHDQSVATPDAAAVVAAVCSVAVVVATGNRRSSRNCCSARCPAGDWPLEASASWSWGHRLLTTSGHPGRVVCTGRLEPVFPEATGKWLQEVSMVPGTAGGPNRL